MNRERIVPLIVAVALFMENMDSTVIATSLPAIAADIGTNPLALKVALTSYLISLAVFIPASGWTADRFGARTVFAAAIAIFIAGSVGCALAGSLEDFVIARIVQGMGGAMMTPVGRLVLVRTIDKRKLIGAMAWVTIPALIGPVVGPPVGGFITTFASWHWIFLINVPFGLVGIVLVLRFIDPVRAERVEPFDGVGLLLAGLGVAGLAFGLSVAGLDLLPWQVIATLIAGGAVAMGAYLWHARRTPAPILDFSLLRLPTFHASFVGGFLFRLGVGALPFLLPLMLQTGFGLNPFQSGMITFAAAVGGLGMKTLAARIINRFGFRRVLMVDAVVSAAFIAACAAFTPATPLGLIVTVLLIGGFFRSLQFTSVNSIAYADIETARMSRATALASVGQQLSLSAGVAVGAFAVETSLHMSGSTEIGAGDFAPAFLLVGAISAASVFVFMRLPRDAGAELSGHMPVKASDPIAPGEDSDRRMG
ncbi:MAG: DHA2 family efflux MFS transporter permease subunit [Pseudorhodoplanes sp.]|nr:putative transport protein HsrA [Pseudorhodoplanes sp.]MBW7950260.1 DHA2 family efflux MFS transporter permease subunit [Pseudorhodoplanes sp.]MCL4712579.1 DHA2 family efflux MFS transporter permease subunit [Pseudorhodoplanes sp.]MCQ3942606.1 MFS transporter [Alphaproteobacteria bacterium]GIK79089.1 MAG: MFS transporter [Alphaproteobacteria bacterium]